MSSNADRDSVYALTTHCMAESVVAKSASIFGSATLTTDSSTNAIVDANTAAPNTQRRCWSAQRASGLIERMARSSQGRALRLINARGSREGRTGRMKIQPRLGYAVEPARLA